tara:strand:+ start:348 stop:911 length:564 start_codon:yes stop_codon:yes gene_type:complete
MMKEQARPMPIPVGQSTVSQEEQEMANLGIENLSEEEIVQAKGIVENIVKYIYSDGAPDILEQASNGSPQRLGEIAGNLVTNEIALEEEAGKEVSRDMEIAIMEEVVHELTDLVMHENIVDLPDEKSEQMFMGEALTYAIGAAIESDDPQFTGESVMQMVTNLINSSPQQGEQPTGVLATQEGSNGI